MQITTYSIYRGVNVLAPVPVIRFEVGAVRLGSLHDPGLGGDFEATLRSRLPGLGRYDAGGSPMTAHPRVLDALAWTIVALQRLLGADVAFRSVHASPDLTRGQLTCEYAHPRLVLLVANEALGLVLGSLPAAFGHARLPGAERDAALQRLRVAAQTLGLNSNATEMIKVARRRDIPTSFVSDHARAVRLGQGRHQRRLFSGITDRTSHAAVLLANNKLATGDVLARAGVPVPAQRAARSEDEAIAAARQLGYPVVVKPIAADMARGVRVGLRDDAAVRAAYRAAQAFGSDALVQSHVPGREYRLLLYRQRLVAAYRREPGGVTGDGTRTVRALVAALHEEHSTRDPLAVHVPIELDAEADRMLAAQRRSLDSVPEPGAWVPLRERPSSAHGGHCVDVTASVHPEVRRMAARIVALVGLDVTGIDYLCDDIGQAPRVASSAVIDVNQSPRIRTHLESRGNPPPVFELLMDELFEPASPSRIPIAVLVGSRARVQVAAETRALVEAAGMRCVLAGTHTTSAVPGYRSASAARIADAMTDVQVETGIAEITPQDLVGAGLGLDACTVAALIGPADGEAHDDPDTLCAAARVVAGVTRGPLVVTPPDWLPAEVVQALDPGRLLRVPLDRAGQTIARSLAGERLFEPPA